MLQLQQEFTIIVQYKIRNEENKPTPVDTNVILFMSDRKFGKKKHYRLFSLGVIYRSVF